MVNKRERMRSHLYRMKEEVFNQQLAHIEALAASEAESGVPAATAATSFSAVSRIPNTWRMMDPIVTYGHKMTGTFYDDPSGILLAGRLMELRAAASVAVAAATQVKGGGAGVVSGGRQKAKTAVVGIAGVSAVDKARVKKQPIKPRSRLVPEGPKKQQPAELNTNNNAIVDVQNEIKLVGEIKPVTKVKRIRKRLGDTTTTERNLLMESTIEFISSMPSSDVTTEITTPASDIGIALGELTTTKKQTTPEVRQVRIRGKQSIDKYKQPLVASDIKQSAEGSDEFKQSLEIFEQRKLLLEASETKKTAPGFASVLKPAEAAYVVGTTPCEEKVARQSSNSKQRRSGENTQEEVDKSRVNVYGRTFKSVGAERRQRRLTSESTINPASSDVSSLHHFSSSDLGPVSGSAGKIGANTADVVRDVFDSRSGNDVDKFPIRESDPRFVL